MYVCNVRGRKGRESRVFQIEGLCGGVWGGVGATDRRECHFGAGCGIVELGRRVWLGAREERAAAETRSRSTGVRTHDITRVTVWVVVKIDAVDTRGGSARRFSRRKADGTDSGVLEDSSAPCVVQCGEHQCESTRHSGPPCRRRRIARVWLLDRGFVCQLRQCGC